MAPPPPCNSRGMPSRLACRRISRADAHSLGVCGLGEQELMGDAHGVSRDPQPSRHPARSAGRRRGGSWPDSAHRSRPATPHVGPASRCLRSQPLLITCLLHPCIASLQRVGRGGPAAARPIPPTPAAATAAVERLVKQAPNETCGKALTPRIVTPHPIELDSGRAAQGTCRRHPHSRHAAAAAITARRRPPYDYPCRARRGTFAPRCTLPRSSAGLPPAHPSVPGSLKQRRSGSRL